MKKKGFTIIEMLAVITLITIFLSISFPKVISIYNRNKMKTWENTVTIIEEATKNYVREYRSDILNLNSDGDEVYISLQTIVDKNLLNWPLTDARDNTSVNINSKVKVKIEGDVYIYAYQEEVKG